MKYILKQEPLNPANFKIDYRGELNDEQYRVVTDINGPCLVLAGAGSGKTRTLVYRVAYMIESGVDPKNILLMTFTNKASREMLSRVEQLLKASPKGLWGGTFHHVGNRILRIYGKHIGIEPTFTILDSEDAKDLIKTCMEELAFPKDKYLPKADALAKIISLSANLDQSVPSVIAKRFSYIDEGIIPKIEAVTELYIEKKRRCNSLDYDDLLTKWLFLLKSVPEVRARLQQKFKYILVDEYQDTNLIQNEIVTTLAGKKPNVLAVGDDSQSIYSFRGATVTNILQFPSLFPGCKMYKLETNYRSSPEILELANASIKHNLNQFEKNLKTHKPSADKPAVVALSDSNEQADFICQRILELTANDSGSLNDVAILFRAHFQSLEIEMALSKRSIPYEMRGGLRFFEQAHIKDVVAHLKAFANVNDEISWRRILRLQAGVGDVGSGKIWSAIAETGAIEKAVALPAETFGSRAASSLTRLFAVFSKMTQIGPNNVASLISLILASGYQQHVRQTFDNFQDRIDDLDQLVDYASGYETLDKFLEDVALSEGFKGQSITGYQDGPNEAVTLSTVHQAKGLEWKTVFLIGLVDGQFPHAKVFERPDEVEEERRLFYVASTRAKEQLYLTYPVLNARGDTFNRPSQFITEIPQEVYEKWDIEHQGGNSDYSDLGDGEVEYVSEETGSILDKYFRQKRQR